MISGYLVWNGKAYYNCNDESNFNYLTIHSVLFTDWCLIKENLFNIKVESQEQEVSLSSKYGTKVTSRFSVKMHASIRPMPAQRGADTLPSYRHKFFTYRRDLIFHVEIRSVKPSFPSLVKNPLGFIPLPYWPPRNCSHYCQWLCQLFPHPPPNPGIIWGALNCLQRTNCKSLASTFLDDFSSTDLHHCFSYITHGTPATPKQESPPSLQSQAPVNRPRTTASQNVPSHHTCSLTSSRLPSPWPHCVLWIHFIPKKTIHITIHPLNHFFKTIRSLF